MTLRASCQWVFMSLRWSWGSQEFQSWNVHPRQMLCWCWCFSGTVKVPWASPLLDCGSESGFPTRCLKQRLWHSFSLFSLWIGLLKGRGKVFLIGLCSEQHLGWERFWPCSARPLDLPCNNPRHLHGREKEAKLQMHDLTQRPLNLAYTEPKFAARDFSCLHLLLSCTV